MQSSRLLSRTVGIAGFQELGRADARSGFGLDVPRRLPTPMPFLTRYGLKIK